MSIYVLTMFLIFLCLLISFKESHWKFQNQCSKCLELGFSKFKHHSGRYKDVLRSKLQSENQSHTQTAKTFPCLCSFKSNGRIELHQIVQNLAQTNMLVSYQQWLACRERVLPFSVAHKLSVKRWVLRRTHLSFRLRWYHLNHLPEIPVYELCKYQ